MEETNGESIYGKYPGFPTFDEGIVPHFEDVPKKDKKAVVKSAYYLEVERLIIQWSNDGTKTAGTLARRICNVLK